ncbi:MAG: hypothetical protein AB1750_05105 [Chloroflexota bacterium]
MAPRKTASRPETSLYELEAHLAGTLRPVQPPTGLVQRLRDRVRIPEPRLLAARLANWRHFFVVFGSVVSGMLVAITLARALFHLFGRKSA